MYLLIGVHVSSCLQLCSHFLITNKLQIKFVVPLAVEGSKRTSKLHLFVIYITVCSRWFNSQPSISGSYSDNSCSNHIDTMQSQSLKIIQKVLNGAVEENIEFVRAGTVYINKRSFTKNVDAPNCTQRLIYSGSPPARCL